MLNSRNIVLCDRLGRRLQARMYENGHIQLNGHSHRYTYARINQRGEVELYDDGGNFSYATLEGDSDDTDDAEPSLSIVRGRPESVHPAGAQYGFAAEIGDEQKCHSGQCEPGSTTTTQT